jgi:hypothetical protein
MSGTKLMGLKTRLTRLEIRQPFIWPKLVPAPPEPEPFDFKSFLPAVDSGQEGSMRGLDFGAFREFLQDIERMQEISHKVT